MTDQYTMTGAEAGELLPLVKKFHYSRRLPGNPLHCYAVRKSGGLFGDTGEPVAGIMFSMPSTKWAEEVIELSRLVRSPEYDEPLSSLISFATGWLKKAGWNLAISYADWTQRHHGGIYQAAGCKGTFREPSLHVLGPHFFSSHADFSHMRY